MPATDKTQTMKIVAGILRHISAAETHIGAGRRTRNEDAFLDRPDLGLWVVADGAGGHADGGHASATVVDALAATATPISAGSFLSEVKARIHSANEQLYTEARRQGGDRTATTVVSLLVFERDFAVLWAGDSRLYLLRDETLRQLSRDHSRVQDLIDNQIITAEEARRHPEANIITRAVGAMEDVELDMVQGKLQRDDVFLLCSDGLTKVLTDEEIEKFLLLSSVEEAPRTLIASALGRGVSDNVTAVVIRCCLPSSDEDEETTVSDDEPDEKSRQVAA